MTALTPTSTVVEWDDWLRLFASRNDIAEEYARLLRQHGPASYDYAPINQAILRRWSMAGLKYVKTRAWKIATQDL